MLPPIPAPWKDALGDAITDCRLAEVDAALDRDARRHVICPPRGDIFRALALTPPAAVEVLLLGQDPYPRRGHAHGLAFSVRPGIKPPPSLRNIFRELEADLGCRPPNNGCLEPWAAQGVLLLNAVLTLREGEPNSHRGIGWERLTDAIIRHVAEWRDGVVFVLWGGSAQRKARWLDPLRHAIITGAHPSPLSARHGFFGTRPFSRINTALVKAGKQPIDWQLPDV